MERLDSFSTKGDVAHLQSWSRSIVEILFPKETLRARALEIIIVHKIEVSEGVSIFIEKRKINILLPHRIRMVRYPPKFNILE